MRRWAAIAGFVFVVLAFVSRAVRGNIPDSGSNKVDALAKYTKFYADKSHNSHALVALVLGFIGLFAFAWFLGAVWSTLRNAEGGATMPTIIVAIGGAAFIALGLAEHAFADVMGITLHFSKGFREGGGFNAGTALVALVKTATKKGIEVSAHDILKTAPRGYPRDHPRVDLLRQKGLITWKAWPVGAWLGTKQAKTRVVEFLRASQPINGWLAEHVGPTTMAEAR